MRFRVSSLIVLWFREIQGIIGEADLEVSDLRSLARLRCKKACAKTSWSAKVSAESFSNGQLFWNGRCRRVLVGYLLRGPGVSRFGGLGFEILAYYSGFRGQDEHKMQEGLMVWNKRS